MLSPVSFSKDVLLLLAVASQQSVTSQDLERLIRQAGPRIAITACQSHEVRLSRIKPGEITCLKDRLVTHFQEKKCRVTTPPEKKKLPNNVLFSLTVKGHQRVFSIICTETGPDSVVIDII